MLTRPLNSMVSIVGPSALNSLPSELHSLPWDLSSSFYKLLKTVIFAQAWGGSASEWCFIIFIDRQIVDIDINLLSRKKLSNTHAGDWTPQAKNYVAKCYMEKVNRDVYFEDVRLQMDAKLWGEEYNRHKPPKKVIHSAISCTDLSGLGTQVAVWRTRDHYKGSTGQI